MRNKNLSITAILGLVAVILGAFGAHSLKDKIGADALITFETGVRYQMYHVIVLLIVNCYHEFTYKTKRQISSLFFLGILLFSGSLYAISAIGVDPKSIWFVTPIGGLFFILGWLKLALSFYNKKV